MALTAVLVFLSALGPVTAIRLDGNGYTDILIVINPQVQENEELINQAKEMIINGSNYLFEALDHKVFFKEVKILVPPNWMTGKYERARNESYDKGRIRIDNPHPSFGDDPYTHQTGDCGEEGDYIHFTPNFLLNNDLIQVYGPRGRVFVHEWAHLRWGVFDEYNKKEPFYKKLGNILPTRCTDKISGQWHEIINQQTRPCRFDANGKPTSSCEFFPDKVQNTNASIMYLQSLESVKAFCQEGEHNIEAPNEQNTKCSNKATHTVIFEDSEDKDALQILKPFSSPLPTPTFKVLQRGSRVVCLVLDVSGSMHGPRISNQRRSATVLLNQCIKEKETVGIVSFSSGAQVLSPLTLIDGQASRDSLINKLPTVASGGTQICKGLRKGLELLEANDKTAIGDEIIFLTDGEAGDNVGACLQEALDSGAIIHTIAFGTSADPVLKTMAEKTGGEFHVAGESVVSNELLDAFCSITMFDGNPITQLIQLESTAKNVVDWFNGTVPIDRTVGNHTAFTITHEKSAPTVYIKSPSGLVYDQRNTSSIAGTITCTVPGTAEPGDWKYSFLNKESTAQAIGLIVMSRAAREDVHPVTVTARINKQTSDGTKPMVVLAEVSQNYNPVVGATVWANLASDTGHSVPLELLDNGAGADAFKDDGVYSRYFTKLKRGKYSLKLRVINQHGGIQLSSRTHSGALYVPGYIVDGQVELNPPKPTINVPPADVGSFTRTTTGESFVVEADGPSNFPPNKITDLTAEMQEGIVLLNWTAPGEDFDEGKAQSYEIRWSDDLKTLQNNFNSTNLVNTSALVPQESGSREHHSFKPNITIQNDTTFFFAVETLDHQSAKSEISNIARATNYAPSPRPPPISNPGLNLTAIIVSVCTVAIVACVLTVVITCALKKKRHR